MLIWRYEHPKSGKGPYRHEGHKLYRILHKAHGWCSKHPSPQEEGLGRPEGDWFCGVRSKKSLTRWFWGFNLDLRREGFRVVCYEIDEKSSRISKKSDQVVFHKRLARRLEG